MSSKFLEINFVLTNYNVWKVTSVNKEEGCVASLGSNFDRDRICEIETNFCHWNITKEDSHFPIHSTQKSILFFVLCLILKRKDNLKHFQFFFNIFNRNKNYSLIFCDLLTLSNIYYIYTKLPNKPYKQPNVDGS